MDWTAWLVGMAMIGAGLFLVRHIGINLSATSVLLSLLLLFHGPAYLYYTRVWGPETDFFEKILSAAPGVDVIQSLDIALATLFVSICIGIKLVDLLTATKGARIRLAINQWGSAPVHSASIEDRRLGLFVFASIIFMLPFVFIDQQLPKVLTYFTSNLGEFEKIALRREGGGSSFYLYNLLASNFFPFVAFGVVAARVRDTRRDAAMFMVFLVFFCLLVLSKAATLSKAPLVILVVQFAVVFFMSRSLQISARLSAWILGIAIGGFMAMAMVANSTLAGLADMLDFLFYRAFMIVNEGLVEYFSAIPYVIDHTWNPLPGWITGETKLATYWLVGEVHRGVLGSTTTAMFLADAWADLAWLGVVLASLAMGGLVRFLDVKLILQQGPGIFTIAALALAHQGIFVALNTSLQTAMFTGGLLFVLPFSYLLSAKRTRTGKKIQMSKRAHVKHKPSVA
jgi:hypothetical protein